MNRRDMLKGLATLPLLAVSLKAAARVPVIYGDGVHDDTEGLAAWLNGRPVVWADGRDVGHVLSGEFRTTRTVEINRRARGGRLLTQSTLRYEGDVSAPMLSASVNAPDTWITNCHFIGAGYALTGAF